MTKENKITRVGTVLIGPDDAIEIDGFEFVGFESYHDAGICVLEYAQQRIKVALEEWHNNDYVLTTIDCEIE